MAKLGRVKATVYYMGVFRELINVQILSKQHFFQVKLPMELGAYTLEIDPFSKKTQ